MNIVLLRPYHITTLCALVVVAFFSTSCVQPPQSQITLYFGNTQRDPDMIDCARVFPVTREISTSDTMEVATMHELLMGPTNEERDAGFTSFFSDDTKNMLRDITISDATATVDLDRAITAIIPNATSSCGSSQFLAQIETTLTELPHIDSVVILLDGSAEDLQAWLQR